MSGPVAGGLAQHSAAAYLAAGDYGKAEVWGKSFNSGSLEKSLGPQTSGGIGGDYFLPPDVGEVGPSTGPAYLDVNSPNGDLMGPKPPPLPDNRPQAYVPAAQPPAATAAGAPPLLPSAQDGPILVPYSTRLPSYQAYSLGPRTVRYTRVSVPEENAGVVINAEFPTLPLRERLPVHLYDGGIRNQGWHYIGPRCKEVQRMVEEPIPQWQHHTGDHEMAFDVKGQYKVETAHLPPQERLRPRYDELMRHRKGDGFLPIAAKVQLSKEMLNEQDMQEFFANREAVMYESIDSKSSRSSSSTKA